MTEEGYCNLVIVSVVDFQRFSFPIEGMSTVLKVFTVSINYNRCSILHFC